MFSLSLLQMNVHSFRITFTPRNLLKKGYIAITELTQVLVTNVFLLDDNISTIPKVTYPRWYFRKRFWSAPRKTVYVAPTAVEATDSQSASSSVNGGFVAAGNGGVVVATKTYGGSLFDDIFNVS